MTRKPDIELTVSEHQLLERITFNLGDHDAVRASLAPMASLAESLLGRSAIPAIRLSYFTDPECNIGGRGKSREDVFERNGTAGVEILSHPHFLKYLEYFIFGPDLPLSTIDAFKKAASYNGYLDGEDISDLIPDAKALVRQRRLDPHDAAEEFFKLALECGTSPSSAATLHQSIRAVRLSRGG